MEQTDEQIMMEFQAGNQEAVRVIFVRYKIRIFNFTLRFLGNRADAEDVTADVFLSLFKKKYAFHPEAKFSTWLFTVARNSAISQQRKRKGIVGMWFKSKSTNQNDQWQFEDSNPIANEQMMTKETAHYVQKAIEQLPYDQREAIILREYQQFSYDDISAVMDCSLEKVKILIFRARENLKGQLSSFMKEEESW